MDRETDSWLSCSEDGYYNPQQCRPMSSLFECFCVTRDGTKIEGTTSTVISRDDAPDCEDRGISAMKCTTNIV